MMKERPILFSAEMVRAILEGRKTQTRRVIKPNWSRCLDLDDPEDRNKAEKLCPYGEPGDRLWVRETFWHKQLVTEPYYPGHYENGAYVDDGMGSAYFHPDMLTIENGENGNPSIYGLSETISDHIRYVATDPNPDPISKPYEYTWIKRPSIFMPRWASRLTLEIKQVRIERLQEIIDHPSDCIAEGIEHPNGYANLWKRYGDEGFACEMPWVSYSTLWDSINFERGFGWDTNPWVWAIGFDKVSAQ